jgi:hypothetical protein
VKFKVGDVCVLIDHPLHRADVRKLIGTEVTITGPMFLDGYGAESYPISGLAHYRSSVAHVLVLKRPPREELGSWADCVWKPSEVTA